MYFFAGLRGIDATKGTEEQSGEKKYSSGRRILKEPL